MSDFYAEALACEAFGHTPFSAKAGQPKLSLQTFIQEAREADPEAFAAHEVWMAQERQIGLERLRRALEDK